MADDPPPRGQNPGLAKTGDRLLLGSGAISLCLSALFYAGLHLNLAPFRSVADSLIGISGLAARRYEILQQLDGRSGDGYIAGVIGFLAMSAIFGTRLFLAHRRECHSRGEHQNFNKLPFRKTATVYVLNLTLIGILLFLGPGLFGPHDGGAPGLMRFPWFILLAVMGGMFGGLLGLTTVALTLRQLGEKWRT